MSIRMGKIVVPANVDEELVQWVDERIQEKRFRNRSHAFEEALYRLRESMNEAH